MKTRFLAPLAIAALVMVPQIARADGATGMSGVVVDATTLAPINGATIIVTRNEAPPRESRELTTDRHGFFADLALAPGGYFVTTNANGQTVTCIVENVPYGVVRNMRILVGAPGKTPECRGALTTYGLVDPELFSSLYPV
jgi:Carboxypeptidase regulatory-like domain